MPITLITGTPGAGKTLLALETLLKMAGVKSFKSLEGIRQQLHSRDDDSLKSRPIVVCGVEGLVPDLFIEMESPLDWGDYDDGTLFLVDEAWKWFGAHDKNVAKDPRFLSLAEHRHRGMDFILTAQMPAQLQQHLRGLVSPHLHVTRKFGTKLTVLYEWPTVQSNPNSVSSKASGIEKTWSQPQGVFAVYQSATMHTIKRKLPARLILMGIAAVVVVLMFLLIGYVVKKVISKADPSEAKAAAAAAADPGVKSLLIPVVTADDYRKVRMPRLEAVPASAPIFDGREVTAYPAAYCIASGDDGADSCRCVTEQNTRLVVDGLICREMARWGGAYDEYRVLKEARGERADAVRAKVDGGGAEGAEGPSVASGASGTAFGRGAAYGDLGSSLTTGAR